MTEGRMLAGETTIEHISGYLSGKVAYTWPGSLVVRTENPERWFLRRPGEPDVPLGDSFRHAKMSLYALREWPGALVLCTQNPECWVLQRPGLPDVGLGESVKRAEMSLYAMTKAVRREAEAERRRKK